MQVFDFSSHFETWLWVLFSVLIIGFLVIDLGILHRKPGKISTQSALIQSSIWVSISLAFGLFIYFFYKPEVGVQDLGDHAPFWAYLQCYITEYALSVDNIFVIILILRFFKIEEDYYHGVLFWGILGAVLMRGIFIFVGALLIEEFHWILYFFGLFLLYTGLKMLTTSDEDEANFNPENNFALKFARKYFHFTSMHEGGKFFLRKEGILYFTPLFMVLVLIETTDLIFAVDSIPVAFSITQDAKLAPDIERMVLYTSNIFAVMGLRAMFFLLSNILDKFYLLKKGLSFVLIFIGFKMVVELLQYINLDPQMFKIPPFLSFAIILCFLAGSIILSLVFPQKKKEETALKS